MLRFTIVWAVFSLLACGAQESQEMGAGAAAESAAAGVVEGDAPDLPYVDAAMEAAAEAHASVASCLDLVRSGAFEEALPRCLEAAGVEPDNAEVQGALEQAQSAVAAAQAEGAAAAAQAAADEAAAEAAEDAAGQVSEGLGDRLP
jgi:hypothetical protein